MTYSSLTLAEFMKWFDHEIARCRNEARHMPIDCAVEAQRRLVELEMQLHEIHRITEEYE
jgi:hypothetical protein